MRRRSPRTFARWLSGGMFGRCALRLRQYIHIARKRGILSRRRAAGSRPLIARHWQVHAPCEVETGNGHEQRSAREPHRDGVLGYKGAYRTRLAQGKALRGRGEGERKNGSPTWF